MCFILKKYTSISYCTLLLKLFNYRLVNLNPIYGSGSTSNQDDCFLGQNSPLIEEDSTFSRSKATKRHNTVLSIGVYCKLNLYM